MTTAATRTSPPVGTLLMRGLFDENPVFRLALSLCPAVAVTTTVKNGIMLGVAVFVVQVLSSVSASLLKNIIIPKIRIPIFTIIIAIWVSVMDMVLAAFFPDLYSEVGLYVKLIVAFAIIISRMELFAMKHPVMPAFWDGFGMGLGFLVAMILTGALRELLGSGSVFGIEIIDASPLLLAILPAGGFFTIGLIMALFNWVDVKRGLAVKDDYKGCHG
ncbi:MAG: electron transport complex subunit RsxE [Gammaproteobacteria bacterium]|nr:electron transport complex subunit RsxE [Gammaproteobacteria bacterium]